MCAGDIANRVDHCEHDQSEDSLGAFRKLSPIFNYTSDSFVKDEISFDAEIC